MAHYLLGKRNTLTPAARRTHALPGEGLLAYAARSQFSQSANCAALDNRYRGR
jgi:hypothetical protein